MHGTRSVYHTYARDTQRCALAMTTTLMLRPQMDMPHLRIVPYKEGVTIVQIQMPFHAVACSLAPGIILWNDNIAKNAC